MKPIFKAVPQPELSLTEIFQFVPSELQVWQALMIDPELNMSGIDIVSATACLLSEVSTLTKKEDISNAVNNFAEWCDTYEKSLQSKATGKPETTTPMVRHHLDVPSRQEVEQEIDRLNRWVRMVDREMMPLTQERADIEDTLMKEVKWDRYEQLAAVICQLVQLQTPVQAKIMKLNHYLKSLLVVEEGLPKEVVGQVLPAIPYIEDQLNPTAKVVPVEATVVTTATTVVASNGSGRKVEWLRALAKDLSLLPIQVLIFSLYELFGPKNERLGGKQRGLFRVMQTANDLGILRDYGWEDHKSAITGSTWNPETLCGYLSFRGQPKGRGPTYLRSEKVLPWRAQELFSESQVDEFLRVMSEVSIKK